MSSTTDSAVPASPLVKHTTSEAAATHPFIDTSVPSINPGAPAELDSTPVSPVSRRESWKVKGRAGSTILGPDVDEEEAYEELSGEQGANGSIRQKRKELLEERSKDPGVLVDIPNTPGPEEYVIAQDVVGRSVASTTQLEPVTTAEVAAVEEKK